jgi:putative ABC transport system permease protein
MRYLRDLARRPVRTTLTILGITIGIWALVVFGSMANKIDSLVKGGSDYYADKIIVTDGASTGGFSSTPMSLELRDQLLKVDGVAAVMPSVMMLMDPGGSTVNFGVPPMISGNMLGAEQGHDTFQTTLAEGRKLTADDATSQVTVLGSDIARKYNKHVGDTIMLHDRTFEIVGVLEPTLTAPDQAASVPFKEAQLLFYEALPPVIRLQVSPNNLVTSMTIFPVQGTDTEGLADRIEAAVPGVTTMTGKDFDKQIGSSTSILNAILVGIALISLIVGGLSVVNTMAMSIAERTREIGIKRAIGGSRSRIVREFVTEASLIGFLGGVIGLLLGAAVVLVVNEGGRSSGTVLFELTAGTAITAVVFSTVLGAIAGFVPALHAARLDPVTALRYE